MHLEWSVFSLADRTAIFETIEADNPRAAIAIDDRIETRVEGLAQFPEMGRPGRIEGTRELVIPARPTSPPIALSAILCGYCVYFTVPSNGRMKCRKN